MQIFIGSLNILLALTFLIIPIIFIELGRPKDLIKASLLLISGIALVISSNSFTKENLFILIINTLILTFLIFEVFKNRWNELTEKEKKEFITISTLNSKLKFFINALKLTFQKIYPNSFKVKFLNNNSTSKKWVRDENKNIEKSKFKSSSKDFEPTNTPKKDIIKDEKN